MKDNLPDNRVDLFYVADRLVEILDANDKEYLEQWIKDNAYLDQIIEEKE